MSFFDDIGSDIGNLFSGGNPTAPPNSTLYDPSLDPNDPAYIGYAPVISTQPQPQPPFNGTISINQSGTQVSGGTLNTILNDVLSGLAILNKAPYVPTTAQPRPQQIYSPSLNAQGQPYNVAANLSQTGSTGAAIESFVRNNTGLLLAAGVAFLLLQSKGFSRR